MAKPKRHLPMSATIAIIIHVVAAVLFVIGYQIKREYIPGPETNIHTVKVKVINTKILAEEKRRKELERLKQAKQAEERLKQEEIKKKLKAELAAAKREVEEAQKRAEQERKKVAEIKKQTELEKKQLEEEAKKKAKEAKKLAEEKKRKEQEKLIAEQAAEQERLIKILEQEEAELKEAEQEVQRAAHARKMSKLIAQYQDAIRSRIQSRWRKPINEQPDAWCKVYVQQAPGGYVENVVVEECTGDETFRRSVEEAVWKSDPLPSPPLPELFDKDLRFKFIPRI